MPRPTMNELRLSRVLVDKLAYDSRVEKISVPAAKSRFEVQAQDGKWYEVKVRRLKRNAVGVDCHV